LTHVLGAVVTVQVNQKYDPAKKKWSQEDM